jgi:hypothetical protein
MIKDLGCVVEPEQLRGMEARRGSQEGSSRRVARGGNLSSPSSSTVSLSARARARSRAAGPAPAAAAPAGLPEPPEFRV